MIRMQMDSIRSLTFCQRLAEKEENAAIGHGRGSSRGKACCRLTSAWGAIYDKASMPQTLSRAGKSAKIGGPDES
jgi:hypothetical protein